MYVHECVTIIHYDMVMINDIAMMKKIELKCHLV